MSSESSAEMYLPHFVVRQKLTMMINRYEVSESDEAGNPTRLMALAEQKRMAFKEQVTFYSDAGKSRAVFGFKARKRLDLNAGYDITDESGAQIGFFRKDFGASLLRSTFHIEGPGYTGTGQERNQLVGLLRRFTDLDFLRSTSTSSTARATRSSRSSARCRSATATGSPCPTVAWTSGSPRPSRSRSTRSCRGEHAVMYPEVRAAVDADAGPDLRAPGFDLVAHREQTRLAALALPREDVAAVADVDADGVRCRLYTPADAVAGLVVHAHGGGFVLNDIDVHDAVCRRMANRGRRQVLSVDYRRPPEARFPAAPDDLDTVVGWLRRTGAGLDLPGPYAAHGDSAGANLALVAALRNPGFFRSVALVYPFLDPRTSFASWSEGAASGFDPSEARWYWEHYARSEADYDDPDLAPLLSDRLHTLPPTFVATAEHDPLRDEGEELARRVAETGVETVGIRCLGQVHGFWRHAQFTASEPLLRQVAGWLDQHLV